MSPATRPRHKIRPARLPRALVVRRAEACATAQPEDLIAWAREHGAACKAPRSVDFVGQRPESGSGKIMRWLLQVDEARRATAGDKA